MDTLRFVVVLHILFTAHAVPLHAGVWTDEFGRPGPDGDVTAAVEFRGELFVGGRFLRCGDRETPGIARWDGERWHTVGDLTAARVEAMIVFEDRLWVAGDFLYDTDGERLGVAAWDGHTWTVVSESSHPNCFAVWNGELYAGGRNILTPDLERPGIARYDDGEWVAVGGGLEGHAGHAPIVFDLAVHEGRLIVAGRFTIAGSGAADALAAWDGTSWEHLGDVPLVSVGPYALFGALESFEGRLYATGAFRTPGPPSELIHSAVLVDGTWQPDRRGPDHWMTDYEVVDGTLFGLSLSDESENNVAASLYHFWKQESEAWLEIEAPFSLHDRTHVLLSTAEGVIVGGRIESSTDVVGNNLFRWRDGVWDGFAEPTKGGALGAHRPVRFVLAEGDALIIGASVPGPSTARSDWFRLDPDFEIRAPSLGHASAHRVTRSGKRVYAAGTLRGDPSRASVFLWTGDGFEPVAPDAWEEYVGFVENVFEFGGELFAHGRVSSFHDQLFVLRDQRWLRIGSRFDSLESAIRVGARIIVPAATYEDGGVWKGSNSLFIAFDGREWSLGPEGVTYRMEASTYDDEVVLFGEVRDLVDGVPGEPRRRMILVDASDRTVDLPVPEARGSVRQGGVLGMYDGTLLAWITDAGPAFPYDHRARLVALGEEGWSTVGSFLRPADHEAELFDHVNWNGDLVVVGSFSGPVTGDSHHVARFTGRLDPSPTAASWFDETDPEVTDAGSSPERPRGLSVSLRAGVARFEVPSGIDHVESIEVFDLRGRRVRNLGAVRLTSGVRWFEWTGTDDRGRRVSRGVYLVRARVDGRTETARVLLR